MKIQVSLDQYLDSTIVKNIIYEMAKNTQLGSDQSSSIEHFVLATSKHFFREFDKINLVKLDVEQCDWQQIENNKTGHIQLDCLRFGEFY